MNDLGKRILGILNELSNFEQVIKRQARDRTMGWLIKNQGKGSKSHFRKS